MRSVLLACVLVLGGCGARTGLETPPPAGARDAGLDAGTSDACAPSPEICDGIDQDCDGTIDDGLTCYTLDGDPIEALTTTSCGAGWYAYDAPDIASANPSPDIRVSDRVAVAIVESPPGCGGASIAVIADRPNDGTGGQLAATFRTEPARSGQILVGDEPGECVERAAGVVACAWLWQPCCTDGALVGPLAGDFCTELMLDSASGVTSLVVIDGDETIARSFGATMTLCGRAIPAVR